MIGSAGQVMQHPPCHRSSIQTNSEFSILIITINMMGILISMQVDRHGMAIVGGKINDPDCVYSKELLSQRCLHFIH